MLLATLSCIHMILQDMFNIQNSTIFKCFIWETGMFEQIEINWIRTYLTCVVSGETSSVAVNPIKKESSTSNLLCKSLILVYLWYWFYDIFQYIRLRRNCSLFCGKWKSQFGIFLSFCRKLIITIRKRKPGALLCSWPARSGVAG